MKLLPLLDLNMKSDEVIEVLEHFDLKVVYDFDRLHENTDDLYWASAHQAGFELRFNQRQVLDTVFLYVLPRGEFMRIDPSLAGVPFHGSFGEAKAALLQQQVRLQAGNQNGSHHSP
jgi:hypothetical protein